MAIWHIGTTAGTRGSPRSRPLDDFLARIEKDGIPRVPGTAVFLTRAQAQTPPVLEWYVRHARALHQHVFILCVLTLPRPWSRYVDRLKTERWTAASRAASPASASWSAPTCPRWCATRRSTAATSTSGM